MAFPMIVKAGQPYVAYSLHGQNTAKRILVSPLLSIHFNHPFVLPRWCLAAPHLIPPGYPFIPHHGLIQCVHDHVVDQWTLFRTLQKEVVSNDSGKHLAYHNWKGAYVMEENDETTAFQLLLTIPQVATALNLGRTKIYELIWKENLPVQKFGRAIRVSREDLQRWLNERQQPHWFLPESEWRKIYQSYAFTFIFP
jgi:excisionase family DNA binding protein